MVYQNETVQGGTMNDNEIDLEDIDTIEELKKLLEG